jgi:hypothetical protein
MTNREIVRKLMDAGFVFFKRGSRHDLFAKDGYVVPVPHGTGSNPRAVSSLKSLLRRVERGQLRPAGRFV